MPSKFTKSNGYDDGTGASAVLLKGTYQLEDSVCERVLDNLPRVLVVSAEAESYPVIDMIVTELTNWRPGRQVVLDRLLDLLLVTTLRGWFDRPDSGAPTSAGNGYEAGRPRGFAISGAVGALLTPTRTDRSRDNTDGWSGSSSLAKSGIRLNVTIPALVTKVTKLVVRGQGMVVHC